MSKVADRWAALAAKRSAQAAVFATMLGLLAGQGCPPAANTPTDNTDNTDNSNGTTLNLPLALNGKYAGADVCIVCHANRHEEWGMTNHHKSFQTLKALGQDQNPICLTCHTTGYGDAEGFVSEATTPQLAFIACEACHGPAHSHVSNVADKTLRPAVKVDGEWCSTCHNGFHHDTFSEWEHSGHGAVVPDVATQLTSATATSTTLNNCGVCHSGDLRLQKFILGEDNVSPTLLTGVDPANMQAVTCAICHDPHKNTGNAVSPPAGHDFQLRYPENIQALEASNDPADTSDPERFGLCGQCHRDRGNVTWSGTSRPSHHSVQSNFYLGEMPTPDGVDSLVPNQNSVHRFVPKQCVTCHMQADDIVPGHDYANGAQPYTRHTFVIDRFAGCVTSGCHPSESSVMADKTNLQAFVHDTISSLEVRLDNWYVPNGGIPTWGFSAEGGPQASDSKAPYTVTQALSNGNTAIVATPKTANGTTTHLFTAAKAGMYVYFPPHATTLYKLVAVTDADHATVQGNATAEMHSARVFSQSDVTDVIKKVRFLIDYVANDGSGGVHNPDYARNILDECDHLLKSIGK